MKFFRLAGSRVVKTGVAIFITAWICVLLDWPPVFAVITAIVTIEPTVSDSIKKGIVRFPASAIGSAYAVLFISLFGNSPLTYTLAAVFTIATCFRLRLHAGLLVATLTSVAMVEVIHTNVLMSFFIRLGTTTTGLVVSTVVNMFMMPPDYTKEIARKLERIAFRTGIAAEKVFHDILDDQHQVIVVEQELTDQLDNMIQQTEQLIRFQKEESKYHPLIGSERTRFEQDQKQLIQLRLIHYHIENLVYTSFDQVEWPPEEKTAIMTAVTDMAQSLKHPDAFNRVKHREHHERLTDIFWDDTEAITTAKKQYPANLPPELKILYELLSIYNLVGRYYGKLE
ncbi:aromatic acid exporter family protein [Lentibacillus sp. CBA3610]|uniref:aromatic acid exporter family protein n=1 Tax=Lentibacillus sp. CBA3610 TaxID=2518176 RepID=UPI00159562A7|nr:aromatic acid exporter family protein [Lentibacillus sp. CBA3610]QKY69846.1 aromatic acid exporter family protein [Lentibacillus sp. CBA3610]